MRAGIYGRQSAGSAKSIDDQLAECTRDAEQQQMTVTAVFTDGVSASRFRASYRARGGWEKVLAAVAGGDLDVLVLWESSRGDRDLATWAGLLSLCRQRGVRIRVTSHDRTYDMGHARDWRTLAEDGIDSAYESEKLSQRTRRGVASAAAQGRPPMGLPPYGYRRVYDPATGKLKGQEPDPVTAPIARDVIRQVAAGVPLSQLRDELNAGGAPLPRARSKQWYRQAIREMCLNVAYIGLRQHRGQTYPAGWEPLVDEETFWAAGRILGNPGRQVTARPGRQVHLLTYLATCVNGHPIRARARQYCCGPGCVHTLREPVDGYVTDLAVARLSRPDLYARLRQAGDDADRQIIEARGEAERLRAQLDSWRESAIAGKTSPESLAVIEAGLVRQIEAADARARAAGMPVALRGLLDPGADVRGRWEAMPLPAKREALGILMEVRLLPSGRRTVFPLEKRVEVSWR